MQHEEAARVLLVRAVEETLPERIGADTLLEAHVAAGDPADGAPWVARRAAYLVDHALDAFRAVLPGATLTAPAPWLWVALAGLAGLAANYLGPSERIHAVLNPIVVLIAWNLAVYAGLALTVLRAAGTARAAVSAPVPEPASRRAPSTGRPGTAGPGLVERLVLRRVVGWMLRARQRADGGLDDARAGVAVGRRFTTLWWPVERPALALWLRRLLHLCAIGAALGAVLGTYVRGLFFAYDVEWRSTFLDPAMMAVVLACLFAPAALVLGRPLPTSEDAARLLGPAGDPAAPWIHLYATSALLFVVVPRAILALRANRRLRRAARDVALDLDAPYYCDLLERARAVSPERLEAAIRGAVHDECLDFADQLAALVRDELYDRAIAGRLWAFRDEGGTLNDLEAALRRECEAFGPTLERALPEAQRTLERALVMRVRRLLGDEGVVTTRLAGDLVDEVGSASSRAAVELGEQMTGDVATMVGGIVSTAVALAVGTVSGGFGKTLGIALLAKLVGSGPVGWLIGAVGGLAAAGVALWAGGEQLRAGVKAAPLPAAVLKVALWRARFERLVADGRTRCEAAVRDALRERVEPLSVTIADQVWRGLRPVVGELQRPRPGIEP